MRIDDDKMEIFLCYRNNGAETAKTFADIVNSESKSCVNAWFSDYEGKGNYVLDIEQLISKSNYAVLFLCNGFTDGFLNEDGTLNIVDDESCKYDCVTVREIIEIEKKRQQSEISVVTVNIDGYTLTEQDLIVLKKVFDLSNVTRQDTIQFFKNLQINYYSRRSTQMREFIKRRFGFFFFNEPESHSEKVHVLNNTEFLLKFSIPSTRIIGRETTVNSIIDSLSQNTILVLYGKRYIGKTDVACKVAQELSDKYSYILYLDFNKGTIDTIISQICSIVAVLCGHSIKSDDLVYELPAIMNKNKILFIMDNFNDYDNIRILRIFDSVASTIPISLLFESSKMIIITTNYKGKIKQFPGILIGGVMVDDVIKMAENENVIIDNKLGCRLIELYDGCPEHIQLAIEFCKKFCNGSIQTYITNSIYNASSIAENVNKQFDALPSDSQTLLLFSSTLGQKSEISTIAKYLGISASDIMCIAESLFDESFLVSFDINEITIVESVYEILLQRFVDSVSHEILECSPKFLSSFPLISNYSNESAKTHQKNVVKRVIATLYKQERMVNGGLSLLLKKLIDIPEFRNRRNYLAGNIINILGMADGAMSNVDFSSSYILDASMESMELLNVDFSFSEFENCVFKSIFGSVTAMSFNETKKLLATAFFNGLIIIWNESGKQIAVFMEFDNVVNDIKFVGHFLWACGKDGRVLCWRADDNFDFEIVFELDTIGCPVRAIDVSKNIDFVVIGNEDGTVYRIAKDESEPLQLISRFTHRIKTVALSPDCSKIAIAGDSTTVFILETKQYSTVVNLTVENRWIRCARFADDNNLILGGDSGNVNFINLASGECDSVKNVDRNKVWSVLPVVMDGESYVIAGGNDGQIKVISSKTKEIIGIMDKHSSWVRCLADSTNWIYSGSEDQTICLWKKGDFSCFKLIMGYTKRVFSVCISQNKIYAGLGDHSVIEVDVKSHKIRQLFLCSDQVWTISYNRGLLCAGCDKGDIYVYDFEANRVIYEHHYSTGWIGAVKFQSSNRYIAVGDELGNIFILKCNNKYMISQYTKYKAHDGRVASIIFDNDEVVSIGEDGHINIFDIKEKLNRSNKTICNNLLYSFINVGENVYLIGGFISSELAHALVFCRAIT